VGLLTSVVTASGGRVAWAVRALALVAALALATTSCSHSGPPRPLPRLQFLGDSITVLAAPQIHARFDGRFDVDIDAYIGITTSEMIDNAKVTAAGSPKVVVVNLGTNDVGCTRRELACPGPYSPAQTEANLRSIAAAFPPSTCVVFVDLNTHVLHRSEAEALNRYLHATFPHVVDWDAAYQRSWFTSSIDPHPNDAGRARLAELVDEAISAC